MSIKLKIIKSKEFKANDEPHVHYTCAYKGRVLGVNSMRFEADDFSVEGTTLTIKTDVECVKNVSTDQITGEVRTFVDIVPKLGISIAEF